MIICLDVVFYENAIPFQNIPNRPITCHLPVIDHTTDNEIDPHTLEDTLIADIPNDRHSNDHISQHSDVYADFCHSESKIP